MLTSYLDYPFECSRDFGSQLPAAICCDLNRAPSECAYLKMVLARTGWTDLGQAMAGENEAPPPDYHFGATHEAMSGHGCTRIDLVLVKMVALAAYKKHEQNYGQGIAKHLMIMADFDLPSCGAKVTMPRTPSTIQ